MDTPTPPLLTAETEKDATKPSEHRVIGGIPAHSVLMTQIVCVLLVLLPILGYNIWAEAKATLLMERQFVASIVNSLSAHQNTITTSTRSLMLSMVRAPIMFSSNSEGIHKYLQQVASELPSYDAFLVFTSEAEVLAGIRKGQPLQVSADTVRKRDYFKQALAHDEFVVNSALLLDNGNTVLPMTMPIHKDGETKPVAYLMAAVSLSRQALTMQNMASGAGTTVALFDTNYTPLFMSSGSINRGEAATSLLAQDVPQFLRKNAFHYADEALSVKQTFRLQAPSGVKFVGSIASLSLRSEEPYLYIAVFSRQSSWQEFVTQRYLWLISFMLVIGLLGLYVSARVGKFYFADGLERMATVAELTRKGDLSLRCGKLSGCREIQVTSWAFDLMLAVVERNTTELYQLSLLDPLTGLWNRRHFGDAAIQELALAIRQQYPVTVVMADIDHFKAVNDTYGHSVGDVVLQQFSRTLRGNIRGSDLLARYGGEEFILLLPNTDATGASILLEKLRAMTEALAVAIPDGRNVHFTASFGAATAASFTATPDSILSSLQAKADAALYMAKSAGRNQVVII